MQKRDAVAVRTGARLLIDEIETLRAAFLEGSDQIGNAIGNVVQPRAPLREEARDRRFFVQRLEQLDSAGPTADEHDADALRIDPLGRGTSGAQKGFVVWQCGGDRWDGDCHVIEDSFHSQLPAGFLRRWGGKLTRPWRCSHDVAPREKSTRE